MAGVLDLLQIEYDFLNILDFCFIRIENYFLWNTMAMPYHACAKWKITLPNIVIRCGSGMPPISKMEFVVVIIYSSKPLTTVAKSSILENSRRLDIAVVNLCHLMMKWCVIETKLQNFTLNFKEKLYFPIFGKMVCQKYLQNSRMVLSILCNDVKTGEKKNCLRDIGVNVPRVLLSRPRFYLDHCLIQIFFGKSGSWNFGKVVVILSVIPAVSSSTELSFSVLQRSKANFGGNWDRIVSVIWHYYVSNVLMSIE